MADQTHFDFLQLHLDPQSKAVSSPIQLKDLATELNVLNALHRTLLGPEASTGLPSPINQKRSAQVTKLRESGSAEFRKGRYAEAVRLYSLAIQMALARPSWEPVQFVREEVALLYSNRAQAHMSLSGWAEAAVDAETSVEVKRIGNPKAWCYRGRCLVEMGRLDEAREWVKRGLEMDRGDSEQNALLKEIDERLHSVAEKEAQAG